MNRVDRVRRIVRLSYFEFGYLSALDDDGELNYADEDDGSAASTAVDDDVDASRDVNGVVVEGSGDGISTLDPISGSVSTHNKPLTSKILLTYITFVEFIKVAMMR